MKKTVSWLLVSLLAVSLAACSPAKEKKPYMRLKCPSCGYEFESPAK